jgi:predicted DNA binding CopG/RHH family protein
MKRKKVKYTNEPIEAKIIADFLPAPKDLIRKEKAVKVTLTLSKRSVDFFKQHADKEKVGYQTMMRSVIDKYTDHFTS